MKDAGMMEEVCVGVKMRVEVLMSCEKQDRLRAAVQPVTITPKARPCMHAYLFWPSILEHASRICNWHALKVGAL